MIGVPPLPAPAPAPSLTGYRWWYIAPGRLFGLLVDECERPLEVAFGTMSAAPPAEAANQSGDAVRPAWYPTDASGANGYALTYAAFPLNIDQLHALMPQPEGAAADSPGFAAENGGPSRDAQKTSDSPALREEVDLGVQLQFPVCSFLNEARGDLRLHAQFAAQGHMILTRVDNRIGVMTAVRNLLPLLDPLPPGLYFYEAWLEQVDEDGIVKTAVPVGVVSVNDDGTGTGFRELDADNVDGTGLPIEVFNGTALTAQPRDGTPGQSEYVILEGTLPRTVKW